MTSVANMIAGLTTMQGDGATTTLTAQQQADLLALIMGDGVRPTGNMFDLNQMHTMVTTPANAYATALDELKNISSGSTPIGIAELTASTTNVQVQQGKLEMINGIIKNAVNYLNNRARSLTQ